MRPTVSIGDRPYHVTIADYNTPAPDGEGGYTEALIPRSPATSFASIDLAGARDLERVAAGTAIVDRSLRVVMPWHPTIQIGDRLTWVDLAGRTRVANVVALRPVDRSLEIELIAVEQVLA